MAQKPKDDLFRKKALEHAVTTQKIDEMINIVPRKFWVLLVVLAIVIITAIAWAFLGRIPILAEGEGLLIAEKGALYNAVAPEGATRLTSIHVSPGDRVEKGQILAQLEIPDIKKQLNNAQRYLKKLESEYQELKLQAAEKIKQQRQFINQQNKTLDNILVSETQNLKETKKLLEIKERSFKKGIMSRLDLAITLKDYHQVVKEIERTKEAITQNKINLQGFISKWEERIHQLQLKTFEQEYEVNSLKAKLNAAQEVYSPATGIVTNIQVSIGQKLEGGDVVATISSKTQSLDAVIYIPAKDGKLVKKGMKALVSPTNIKKEEYGSIKGEVIAVASFPSTKKDILATLQNPSLVERFLEKGAVIAVRVSLKKDEDTYSGFAWTSSSGPETSISAGTLVSAGIIIREQRPVSLIIPTLKKATGIGY